MKTKLAFVLPLPLLLLSMCSDDPIGTTAPFRFTQMYVTTATAVTKCSIAADDTLHHCADTGGLALTVGEVTAFSPDGKFAYVSDQPPGVGLIYLCSVDSHGELTGCADTASAIHVFPTEMIATENHLLVANGDQIAVCPRNPTLGVLGTCVDSGVAPQTFSMTLALNEAKTILYFVDVPNGAYKCAYNDATGAITACAAEAAGGLLNVANYLTLSHDGKYVHVINVNLNELVTCNVNATTGSFTNCRVATDPLFNSVQGIRVTADGTKLFAANNGGNNLLSCPMNATGDLSGACTVAADPIASPRGIALR